MFFNEHEWKARFGLIAQGEIARVIFLELITPLLYEPFKGFASYRANCAKGHSLTERRILEVNSVAAWTFCGRCEL